MPIQTIFISEDNKGKYVKAVLTWLEGDFNAKGKPENHFWYNKNLIEQAFSNHTAMVALNEPNEIIGYMIWSGDGARIEIDIIEVKETYRRQGIFKKMLADLTNKFTDLFILSASVLPQAEAVFNHGTWEKISVYEHNRLVTKYFKIVRPVLPQLDTLPNGRVIAVFSQMDVTNGHETAAFSYTSSNPEEHLDFYTIKNSLDKYKSRMKYFQIDLDNDGKLRIPLISSYHYEGYIGIYFNQKLVAEGKAKHLFYNTSCGFGLPMLVLDKIIPREPKLFPEDFFFQSRTRTAEQDNSPLLRKNSKIVDVEANCPMLLLKKQHVKRSKKLKFASSQPVKEAEPTQVKQAFSTRRKVMH